MISTWKELREQSYFLDGDYFDYLLVGPFGDEPMHPTYRDDEGNRYVQRNGFKILNELLYLLISAGISCLGIWYTQTFVKQPMYLLFLEALIIPMAILIPYSILTERLLFRYRHVTYHKKKQRQEPVIHAFGMDFAARFPQGYGSVLQHIRQKENIWVPAFDIPGSDYGYCQRKPIVIFKWIPAAITALLPLAFCFFVKDVFHSAYAEGIFGTLFWFWIWAGISATLYVQMRIEQLIDHFFEKTYVKVKRK